jgi:uncharacterized membrane protein SpoIIM required for sporulation
MTVNEFIQLREKDWQRLEGLISRHKGRKPLNAREVHELGTLYRAIASDLALARRDYPEQRVTLFLNQLLTRTHSFIYQQDVSDFRQLVRYFTERIPRAFRQTAAFTFVAFLLFIIPAIVGYRLAYTNPDSADMFGLAPQRESLADQEIWTDIPLEERPFMSAFIMSNNIRIAILAFGGGVSFGLFTVYVLMMNGLIIGAVMGLAAHYDMGQVLLGFIIGHGVIELSVVFIAGGAGLQLGWALLNPGPYTRRDSLALAARRAVTLAVVSIPLLIIAGLIEGFISPSDLSLAVRAGVGIGTGILLYGYLSFAGHRPTASTNEVGASPARVM